MHPQHPSTSAWHAAICQGLSFILVVYLPGKQEMLQASHYNLENVNLSLVHVRGVCTHMQPTQEWAHTKCAPDISLKIIYFTYFSYLKKTSPTEK